MGCTGPPGVAERPCLKGHATDSQGNSTSPVGSRRPIELVEEPVDFDFDALRRRRSTTRGLRGRAVPHLEVRASDPSVFQNDVVVTGDVVGGHAVLRCEGAAIANTITALVMAVQRAHACDVHLYMGWTPVDSVLDAVAEGVEFLLYGGGDMARLVELEVRREGLSDRVVVRAA